MASDLKSEDIVYQVKGKLNKEKIKLWLQPYYDERNNCVGEEQVQALQLLCDQITEQLNMSEEHCLTALIDLQSQALSRLKSNEVYKETGMANLRVTVSGDTPSKFTINVMLTDNTSALIEDISRRIGIPSERLKLISHGRVLKPSESLVSQGVKNATQLMAVILADSDELLDSEKRFKTLENTKKDVKLLAGRSNQNNEYYLQVENQSGESLNLPYEERKALVTAMALHEKGKAAIKKEDYPLALVLLLEADKEYSACTSELLNACDNYALLHLDIAWCYLCLRNPAQIPDAERRLSLCEQNFHKSYGPNLERLIAIKGTAGNEEVLFLRLHLLQGVVCFHQNKRAEAKRLFERTQSELNSLKVDDKSLCLLLELGFTNKEARLGLRATHGNIEAAEEFLERKRKDRELTKERNHLKNKHERERNKLGMCADGKQFCEPALVEQLVGMGFNHFQCVAALKMANNSIGEAVNLLQDQPHLLPTNSVSEESVAQVASLGFEPEVAREALEKCANLDKVVKSLNNLTQGAGSSMAESLATASTSALSFLEELRKKRKLQTEEEQNAFKRISEDLLDNDLPEDHLDLNLAQEEQFLIEYFSLFN